MSNGLSSTTDGATGSAGLGSGFSLSGKVAVVTGGSRGIGREICVQLARQGARVFVNYASRADAANETVELCKRSAAAGRSAFGAASGGDYIVAEAIGFDVADGSAVEGAFEQIKTQAGRLDILVNNAGIARDGLFIRMKDEDWNATLATNLNGAMNCARAAAKIMIRNRVGRIINISSVVGEMGNAGQVAYVTSKAGLIGMTKALARELAPRAVTVNAVTPGFIETEMTAGLSEAVRDEHAKSIPLSRLGKAEEVAGVVGFLASDASAYITGQILGVNGGMYM
jgi:3-oxoacyl-[acyl-carrier protein] reductase